MANCGSAYFDVKGQFYRTPEEATISDLSGVLGRVGDMEGLSTGIAKILLERREQIERILADHDEMIRLRGPKVALVVDTGKIAQLRPAV